MYWLNGIPRVYSVDGPGIKPFRGHGDNAQIASENEIIEERNDDNGATSESQPDFSTEDRTTPASNADHERWSKEPVTGLCVSRGGHLFVTMTETTVAIWQTRPTAVVAVIKRSGLSLDNYGHNVSLLFRPDSTVLIIQTAHGYLVTYSVATDPNSLVYQQFFFRSQSRRLSQSHHFSGDQSNDIREVNVRFKVAIKIDAGIHKVLALDNEVIVATVNPAAVQIIRWTPDSNGVQRTSAQLLDRISWFPKDANVIDMVHDRAMNIFLWTTNKGEVYAVRRMQASSEAAAKNPAQLFHGHLFHAPTNEGEKATHVAVNARFSLFAVSCHNGEILVYVAKDYIGNVPLSNKLQLPASPSAMGPTKFLAYSPDGYCLFVGYEKGWNMWSVFGKSGSTSFHADRSRAQENDEAWLLGAAMGSWIGGGSDIVLISPNDHRIFILQIARSALTGYFSSANLARALLQTETEIILYRGHDLPDLTTISGKDSLWHRSSYPPAYLYSQWPIRLCVVSQDGRYVAAAGRRGLAHYSVQSGHWKTFEDPVAENSFSVRGGMCWYGHILIAAVEGNNSYGLHLYSRERPLHGSSMLYVEELPSPIIFLGPSGVDSLLVYTYDNILYHLIIHATQARVRLVQVGQIAFNGIIKAPARVRSISWVLPDSQIKDGDPSQDVSVASVLFLIDGKLVLMRPSTSSAGELKYDMRIVAKEVEYYILMRDQLSFKFAPPHDDQTSTTMSHIDISLKDSLWIFCGGDLRVWCDVQEILRPETGGMGDIPTPISVPIDFYPLSILLNKGIALGAESELIQRRDVSFSSLRFAVRTQLFLPYTLQHNLANLDTPSALSICHHFSHLSYFSHALEILLHKVLDEEVDYQDAVPPEERTEPRLLLPTVLSFLQLAVSQEEFLDIVVQCTRKTELRFWKTLFAHLPSPDELFEQALKLDSLKTAGGYLLVLQALDDQETESRQGGNNFKVEDSIFRLLERAVQKTDWELCAELARFLVALDTTGDMLRKAIVDVGLRTPTLADDPTGSSAVAVKEESAPQNGFVPHMEWSNPD